MGLKKIFHSLLALTIITSNLVAFGAAKTYQAVTSTDRGGTGADLSGAVIGSVLYLDSNSPRQVTTLDPTGNGLKIIRFNSGATAIEAVTPSFSLLSGTLSAGQFPSLTSANFWLGNGSNAATAVTMSGDITMDNAGVTTIGNSKVTNAKMSNMGDQTVKGNVSGGVAAPSDLSKTQLTTLINLFTDSLSGAVPASGGGTVDFLRADGAWAAPAGGASGFGGDGSDGAVTKAAVTESNVLQINATTFTQSASTTWTPYGGTHINATGAVTFSGTTNVTANIPGGGSENDSYFTGGNGSGPSPGRHGDAFDSDGNINAGGSGGGCGGRGGRAWGYTPSYPASQAAGALGGRAMPLTLGLTGSGGGAGQTNSASSAGGNGGGRFTVHAVGAITISSGGSVKANGAAGGGGLPGAAGGGSGGVIGFFSQDSITRTGNIELTGGAGYVGGGTTGGGGGGGWFIAMSPSNSGAGSIALTGGDGGSSGSGDPLFDGATGQSLIITGTPNLPTIVWLFDNLKSSELIAFAKENQEATHWQVAKLACGTDLHKCLAFCRPDREIADSAKLIALNTDNIIKCRRRDMRVIA